MNIILFDDQKRENLLPFTYVRPACEIRIGIFRIREKWENWMGNEVSWLTESYLQKKYPAKIEAENLMINGRVLPNVDLLGAIRNLASGEQLVHRELMIAAYCTPEEIRDFTGQTYPNKKTVELAQDPVIVEHPWDIFQKNGAAIRNDYDWICIKNTSHRISDPHTIVYNPENIFIEKGARIKAAVLNAEDGPIYIGKNAEIGEGAVIKGPFALCDQGTVNMGAKIRGDVTIGPHCKVGGEVSNSVFFAYSNKGHDGFMGNSVVAEWCNIGADTNTSNLKNNYADVKVWSYGQDRFVNTGLTFCGLLMGDHTKCGINTMFNTGTIAGVSANIFGSGFPRTLIPSFAWGGAAGFTTFQLRKVYETAEKMMARRKIVLDEVEKDILKHVFEATEKNRIWEK